MTVTAISKPDIPLEDVSAALRREGLTINQTILNQDFEFQANLLDTHCCIAIIAEQGIVTIGEDVTRIRKLLSSNARLILCIPQLTTNDRNALFQDGVSVIATPQSWAPEHIKERVLAQLILDGEIRPSNYGEIWGATSSMRSLFNEIERLAPLSETILILGATGTGKELVAKEIHDHSGRAGIYLPINCPEISPELLSTELFGHEKGAFTGADRSRMGLIAAAGKGTVFLDEIGELDLFAQAKILRLLESHQVRRVGANNWDTVEARVVLATNRNLEELVADGRFRQDLYERIRGFTLRLSRLTERKADIPLLVNHFVEEYNEEYRTQIQIPDGALDSLFRYDWPGNIRELRGVVRKAAAYSDGNQVLSRLILQDSSRARVDSAVLNSVPFDPKSDTWRDLNRRAQKLYFRALLETTHGNKEIAAKLSGLSRSQFFEKLRDNQETE